VNDSPNIVFTFQTEKYGVFYMAEEFSLSRQSSLVFIKEFMKL
jgi:hypothetical protein